MPRVRKEPGEETLIALGVIQRRSPQRRVILGCLACRWVASGQSDEQRPVAYGYQIMKCSGLPSGTVYPILQQLEEGGATATTRENVNPNFEGRNPRRLIQPAESEVGRSLLETATVPDVCHLPIKQLSNTSNPQ